MCIRDSDYTEGTLQTIKKNETFSYRSDGWKDQILSWNGYRYTYDTSGNTETKYYYNGSTLSGLVKTTTGNTGTTKTTVQFVYDAEGEPLLLRFNGKTDYFYLYNGLGDIVGLIDSSNKVVVRYQYDSWGKVTSSEDTSGVSLATLNPFCYRKYVYDPETGLYCLGSRYYDPEVGRFVNADDTDVIFAKPQELGSKNLYAYCDNNPVAREDYVGEFPIPCIVGAVVGAVVSGFSYVLSSGGEIDGVELEFKDEHEARNILELARYANVHTQKPLTSSELRFIYYYPDIAAKVMTVSPYYEPQGAIKERVEARLLTKPHRII